MLFGITGRFHVSESAAIHLLLCCCSSGFDKLIGDYDWDVQIDYPGVPTWDRIT